MTGRLRQPISQTPFPDRDQVGIARRSLPRSGRWPPARATAARPIRAPSLHPNDAGHRAATRGRGCASNTFRAVRRMSDIERRRRLRAVARSGVAGVLRATLCLAIGMVPAVAAAQDLLVTSQLNNRVLRYTSAGQARGTFATGGGLMRPTGMTYGPDGNLYVASGNKSLMLRFDGATGAFIDRFVAADAATAADETGGLRARPRDPLRTGWPALRVQQRHPSGAEVQRQNRQVRACGRRRCQPAFAGRSRLRVQRVPVRGRSGLRQRRRVQSRQR